MEKYQSELALAKEEFTKRDRLPENLLSREVYISWYKCKLAGIKPSAPIIKSEQGQIEDSNEKIKTVLEKIPSDTTYFLTSSNGLVIEKRICSEDKELSGINHLGDLFIGTNSCSICIAEKKDFTIYYNEHFLELLKEYVSSSIYIVDNSYILTLFSKKENIVDILADINAEKNRTSSYKKLKEWVDDEFDPKLEQQLLYLGELIESENADQLIVCQGNLSNKILYYLEKNVENTKSIRAKDTPSTYTDKWIYNLKTDSNILIYDFDVLNDESQKLLSEMLIKTLYDKNFKDYRVFLSTINSYIDASGNSINSTPNTENSRKIEVNLQNLINSKGITLNLEGHNKFDCSGEVVKNINDVQTIRSENIINDMQAQRSEKAITQHSSMYDVSNEVVKESLTLSEIEVNMILMALERNNGNITEAGKQIGLSRATMYRKVNQLKIKGIIKSVEKLRKK